MFVKLKTLNIKTKSGVRYVDIELSVRDKWMFRIQYMWIDNRRVEGLFLFYS